MKTTVYLVRHGDVHNPNAVFYERLPGFPLSDTGRTQAHTIGKILSYKSVSMIYASPLERTKETASIIASYHKRIPIMTDERLLEVRSLLRGKKMVDLAKRRWNFYHPRYLKDGGESIDDIWKRMNTFLSDMVKHHKGQEVVVVSHGDPIMITVTGHKGKKLTLNMIRGEEYIQTGQGYRIIFEESDIIEVGSIT